MKLIEKLCDHVSALYGEYNPFQIENGAMVWRGVHDDEEFARVTYQKGRYHFTSLAVGCDLTGKLTQMQLHLRWFCGKFQFYHRSELLGFQVCMLRKSLGMKQKDFAEKARISVNALENMEIGNIDNYTLADLHSVARAFGRHVELR